RARTRGTGVRAGVLAPLTSRAELPLMGYTLCRPAAVFLRWKEHHERKRVGHNADQVEPLAALPADAGRPGRRTQLPPGYRRLAGRGGPQILPRRPGRVGCAAGAGADRWPVPR